MVDTLTCFGRKRKILIVLVPIMPHKGRNHLMLFTNNNLALSKQGEGVPILTKHYESIRSNK